MDKKTKNPLLAGLINVLIPGSSQLYVNNDRAKFIRAFVVGAIALTVAVLLGSLIQNTRGYSLPQGVCMGSLVTAVAAVLFISGRKVAGECGAIVMKQNKPQPKRLKMKGWHPSRKMQNLKRSNASLEKS